MRYRARITSGERHPIHRDGAQDDTFQTLIRQGHIGWIDVDSTRLSIETATLTVEQYVTMAATIRGLL